VLAEMLPLQMLRSLERLEMAVDIKLDLPYTPLIWGGLTRLSRLDLSLSGQCRSLPPDTVLAMTSLHELALSSPRSNPLCLMDMAKKCSDSLPLLRSLELRLVGGRRSHGVSGSGQMCPYQLKALNLHCRDVVHCRLREGLTVTTC
jgi:hypothetical protein